MIKRPFFRRTPRLERLETREVLSAAGGPSAEAQYMLELINQARTNPAAAADRYTSNLDAETLTTLSYYNVDLNQAKQAIATAPAKPPLAWSDQLATSATTQSQDEANMGKQTHTGADGSDLSTRLNRVGFTNASSAAENTFAYAQSVDEAMQAFLIDWGVPSKGHFNNLLQPTVSSGNAFQSVGIGIVKSNNLGVGPEVITQDFGAQSGTKPDLLGVVFNDLNGDNSYEPGEGNGNATVQAVNLQTGQSNNVQTWSSGGYQMPLDPGQYQVTATVNNQVVGSQQVSLGSQNAEVDFNLSLPFTPPAPPVVVIPPAPVVAPPPPVATPPAVTQAQPVVTQAQPVMTQAQAQVVTQAPPVVVATPVVTAPVQTSSQTQPSTSTPQPMQTQPTITFSAPVVAPVATTTPAASTPTFDPSWITNWTSWNASSGLLTT